MLGRAATAAMLAVPVLAIPVLSLAVMSGTAHRAAAAGRNSIAYVANSGSGTITPISTRTNRPGRAITLPVGCRRPLELAITPDGRSLYAGCLGSEVVPIRTGTGRAGPAIRLRYQVGLLGMLPDGKTLYVSHPYDGAVTPISTATSRPGKPIMVGRNPTAIAFAPDSRLAYVLETGPGVVVPVRTATNRAGRPIRVGRLPEAIAVTPNGRTLYVADYGSGRLLPVSTATGAIGKPIVLGPASEMISPEALAITPDGRTVYVAAKYQNAQGSLASAVYPVSTATGAIGRPMALPQQGVLFLGLSPDGRRLLVIGNAGTDYLTTIATGVNTVVRTLRLRLGSQVVAFTPDSRTAYVASLPTGTVLGIRTATGVAAWRIRVGRAPIAITVRR